MKKNVYVRDELGERIKRVKNRVNWSEVACRAFEVKLDQIDRLIGPDIRYEKLDLMMEETIHDSQ